MANTNPLKTSLGEDNSLPFGTEKSATLFCPSGFVFEPTEEKQFGVDGDFSVKLEDNTYLDSR